MAAVYEGSTYLINTENPEYELLSDKLSSIASKFIELTRRESGSRDEFSPRIIVGEKSGRAILVADVGDGFSVVAIGDHRAVEALVEPFKRLLEGKAYRCPECGVVLDKYPIRCPNCGRLIPFSSPICPFCGYVFTKKRCPNCGSTLTISVPRVRVPTEPVTELVQAGVVSQQTQGLKTQGEETMHAGGPGYLRRFQLSRLLGISISNKYKAALKASIATFVAIVYIALSSMLGIKLVDALIAGAAPLAMIYALLLVE